MPFSAARQAASAGDTSIFVTASRPLDPNERALLDGLLAFDFDGVAALREQARGVRAAPGCTCGCGSLHLFVAATSSPSTAASPIPAAGAVLDDAGEEIGGLLLFLDAGRLSYMEVHSYFDPLPLPLVEHVRWTAEKVAVGDAVASGDPVAGYPSRVHVEEGDTDVIGQCLLASRHRRPVLPGLGVPHPFRLRS